MSEYRSVLERAASNFAPLDLPFERVERGRDRRGRNRRIAAGVVGIAVFVAAVWIVTSVGSSDRTQKPANEPSRGNSAEDVARGFIAAFGAFDSKAAMTYVTEDADLTRALPSNWAPSGVEIYPQPANGVLGWLDLFEAVGYQQTITSCQAVPFRSGASVVCGFDFDMLGSDVLGRGSVTGSSFVFAVRDGEIANAGMAWDIGQVSSQMFEPFAEWVSATHPRDVEVMFFHPPSPSGRPARTETGRLVVPILTHESIRLWRLRTPEYVESVQATGPFETGPAETAPPPPLASEAPEVVSKGECSAGASSRLELTITFTEDGYSKNVRFEVHRSPVGHSWHIVFRHASLIAPPHFLGVAVFEGTRVASDSGDLVAQRRIWELSTHALFKARAVDTQTGQVCKAQAVY